jgi:DNA mismatch repair protein MutS2
MEDQSFKTLEYDQIRELLRRGAQTPMGQSLVSQLQPISDPSKLESALLAVAECVHLRQRGATWSFTELADPHEPLSRLQIDGAVLDPADLLALARLCDAAMSARASILAEREFAPTLWLAVADLPRELNSLTAKTTSKILPSGELDDRASPELARIRHDVTKLRSSITRTLENLMRKSEAAVQDELVTVRNDRFVIPIKSDHRARIRGVAHGFSSSGATTFVEPMEAVEANNELQALREEEQREIHRILFGLTDDLRQNLPSIRLAAEAVAELDFVSAKASFHQRFNCVVPQIGNTDSSPLLGFVAARHPLLEENLRGSGNNVVPASFQLTADSDSMVISGANAGGKTVVLKTAGLLSLLALSGVSVPAKSATVPFYRVVLADIGDHQSLAANLSTFTSHVANISRMLELCQSPALVLLDEVGTGTDPEEGSALGVAVVDHFRKVCGAHVLATTHYSGLKMYAANEPGVLNASVEFDEKTLRPTYRLIVGVAGASSGLEIARRFGVPDEVVDRAFTHVDDATRRAGEYLSRIKREADEATALRKALEEERSAVAEKFASLEADAKKREHDRQNLFRNQIEEASREFERKSNELVAAIADRAERLKVEREAQKRSAELKRAAQKTLQVSQASRSIDATSREPAGVRIVRDGQEVRRVERDEQAPEETFVTTDKREIRVGDKVRLRSFGSVGIVDSIKSDEAEVRVKSLRLREKLGNLELVEAIIPKAEESRFEKLRPREKTGVNVAANVPLRVELNLIGKTSDEAVDSLDKFLDESFMSGATEVRIVHGHGTGVLRNAVANHLKQHPHVQNFAPAPANQGGTGATVVNLKQ